MGHPNRKILRERKKKARERMVGRKNIFDILDLTPHNAIGKMTCREHELKYK